MANLFFSAWTSASEDFILRCTNVHFITLFITLFLFLFPTTYCSTSLGRFSRNCGTQRDSEIFHVLYGCLYVPKNLRGENSIFLPICGPKVDIQRHHSTLRGKSANMRLEIDTLIAIILVIIRPDRSVDVDAVYCYRRSSMVCRSATVVSPAKRLN